MNTVGIGRNTGSGIAAWMTGPITGESSPLTILTPNHPIGRKFYRRQAHATAIHLFSGRRSLPDTARTSPRTVRRLADCLRPEYVRAPAPAASAGNRYGHEPRSATTVRDQKHDGR